MIVEAGGRPGRLPPASKVLSAIIRSFTTSSSGPWMEEVDDESRNRENENFEL